MSEYNKYALSSPSLLPSFYRKIKWSDDLDKSDNSYYSFSRVDSTDGKNLSLQEYLPIDTVKCKECDSELNNKSTEKHNCVKELKESLKQIRDLFKSLEDKVQQQTDQINHLKKYIENNNTKEMNKNHETIEKSINDRKVINTEKPFVKEIIVKNNSSPKLQFNSYEKAKEPIIQSNRVRTNPTFYTYRSGNDRTDNNIKSIDEAEEEVDFGMYGSQKYKYLTQLSRQYSQYPSGINTPDYRSSSGMDLFARNKAQLIDVLKGDESYSTKPIIRVRSWSDRDED